MGVDYRHTVLAMGIGANFAQFGSRVIISPLVPQIIESFTVTKGDVGLALTGMWAIYALLQLPSGVLADRYGERPIILAALLFTGLGSILVALSPSFLLFAVFVLLLGAGAGLYASVGSALLSKLFDDVGQALGIHAMGGPAAALVLPVSAALVSARYGWNAALLIGAVVAFPVLAVWAWQLRPTPPARPDQPLAVGLRPAAITGLLFRPAIAYTIGLATLIMFAFQSFLSFLPTFLVEYHGFSTPQASAIFGIGAALSVVVMPLMGRLSDVFSRDGALLLAMLAGATGFLVFLGTGAGAIATALGVLAFGVGFAWAGPLQGRFTDLLAADERATGFGFVRSVYVFLGAAGSVVTGVLADTAGWPVAFGLSAGLLLVGAVAILANRAFALDL